MARKLKGLGFRFFGPTTAYAMMQAIGLVDDHVEGCLRLRRSGLTGIPSGHVPSEKPDSGRTR